MRLRVGFLFQQAALFDSLNVFDNVAFGLRAKGGLRETDIATRVRERMHGGWASEDGGSEDAS